MNKITIKKKEQLLLTLLARIINQEITNVNVINPTVVEVKLSNDGSHAKVYLTFEKNKQKGLEAINNATGFIKTELSKYWNGRKVPQLHFELDNTLDTSQRIENILKQIKLEENQK